MTAPDPSEPPPSAPARSRFAVLSWVVLVGGLLLTFVVYQIAVAMRRPGEWLPGMGQMLIGALATGLLSFGCGLTALIRREPRWWIALGPFLAGLGTIAYFASNLIRNSLR